MTEPVYIHLAAPELMRLKSATEWLTGYYEGASHGRALPKFVHEHLAKLDEWICATSGMETRQGGNEVPSRSDDSPTAEGGDAQRTPHD